jgi:hypothetical protein
MIPSLINNNAKLLVLKNNMAGNNATVPSGSGPLAISSVAGRSDRNDLAQVIADWYNQLPGTDFFGNYRNVPLDTIKAAIAHKNYTPKDLPPASGSTVQATNDALLYMNRTLFAGSLQMEINNLLVVSSIFDATNASLVASLKDATNTAMPTGTGGATQDGAWNTVQTVICRKGTNAEKVFATAGAPGSGTDGSTSSKAATFTEEETLTAAEVIAAWAAA